MQTSETKLIQYRQTRTPAFLLPRHPMPQAAAPPRHSKQSEHFGEKHLYTTDVEWWLHPHVSPLVRALPDRNYWIFKEQGISLKEGTRSLLNFFTTGILGFIVT